MISSIYLIGFVGTITKLSIEYSFIWNDHFKAVILQAISKE